MYFATINFALILIRKQSTVVNSAKLRNQDRKRGPGSNQKEVAGKASRAAMGPRNTTAVGFGGSGG